MKKIIKKFLLKIFNTILEFKLEHDIEELKKRFKEVGKNFNIKKDFCFYNPQYIEIGIGFHASERFRMEAIDVFVDQFFSPSIKIGNNVVFNTDIHIGCVNSIHIGNNCLFASRIFITDHQHGESELQINDVIRMNRPLISKGPVVIEDNVWIGEGVVILPKVTIGKNSIIGANSVVNKDVPPNCVVAGNPARIIKYMELV